MQEYYGSQHPARDAQLKYKTCKQSASVQEYVQEVQTYVQLLSGTTLEPSKGDVIDKFIHRLKPEPRSWV